MMSEDESVGIWELRFSKQLDQLEKCYAVLNEEEKARAARFYFDKDREAFTLTRGSLRYLLGDCLKQKPESIIFSHNEYGKPELKNTSWQFNVSHSHDCALIAIGKHYPLGIDVEYQDRKINPLELCDRFFAEEEIEQLRSVDPHQQIKTFFNLWTRKEAFIKAVGMGLSFGLDQFALMGLPQKKPEILHISDKKYQISDWQLRDLPMESPYAAALMCSVHIKKINRKNCNLVI